jgi:hypothetical protein
MILGPSNRAVQSLWIGARLTAMEQLSIRSFLAAGHEFRLYCYDQVEGVPAGTTIVNAEAILPRDRLFVYGDGFAKGSPAAFSNFFRYKLLLEHGGWWVDTDVVCLRPFAFADEAVLATERDDGGLIVSTSVIKAPAGDPLMAWAWGQCDRMDTSDIRFGQIGPRLLWRGVGELNLYARMRPHTLFSPLPHVDWRAMLDPGAAIVIPPESYAVHLWNQMWAAAGMDKDAEYPRNCLYEQWKLRRSHL